MHSHLPLSPSPETSSSPLAGKTILVTRSVGQSSQFSDRLAAAGATVIELPALEIVPPSTWKPLDQAISNLSTFHWIILTSSNGVEYFFERLKTKGKDKSVLANVKIAVVGEKTARTLKKYNIQPDFIPPHFVADSLAINFPESLTGKKILFPRVESGGRQVLVKELTDKGAEVIEVPAYESCCPQAIPPAAEIALRNHTLDVITFASSKTVQFFCLLTAAKFPEGITQYLNQTCIASIGPQTSKTCFDLFGRVDIEAEEYTVDGLLKAIIKWANRGQVTGDR
ncbi:uroporphyrinogen-III synthase [Sphaerospermopsis aphanizomenoides]|uniref:uroporphyrinogen-III synthase n=1 Tax=Sphaerospermopsis aphanizomenoides TaxID=459663 RepID=UPI000ACACC8F|nr:uroporphyrinogen-III synthase [Sphaerospermopsis aphanizomenoides]